jgi:glycerol-3-phosphate acyltransferase PlsY
MKGIDLREYGSANVGASNVYRSVAGWAVVPVGLLEIAQGMAGVMLAKFLGQDLEVQVVAGLAAIAGQAWSVFLRFGGGRGIGPSIGFMLGLAPPVLATFIVISLLGWPLRSFPSRSRRHRIAPWPPRSSTAPDRWRRAAWGWR